MGFITKTMGFIKKTMGFNTKTMGFIKNGRSLDDLEVPSMT